MSSATYLSCTILTYARVHEPHSQFFPLPIHRTHSARSNNHSTSTILGHSNHMQGPFGDPTPVIIYPDGGGTGGWNPIDYNPEVPLYPHRQQQQSPQGHKMPHSSGVRQSRMQAHHQACQMPLSFLSDGIMIQSQMQISYQSQLLAPSKDGDTRRSQKQMSVSPSGTNMVGPSTQSSASHDKKTANMSQQYNQSGSIPSQTSGSVHVKQQYQGIRRSQMSGMPTQQSSGTRSSRANPMITSGGNRIQISDRQYGGARSGLLLTNRPATNGHMQRCDQLDPSLARIASGRSTLPSNIGPPRVNGLYAT